MRQARARKKGILFVISGPSGSGKTTLREIALKQPSLRRQFTKSVSLTTRPQRPGEKNGRDYFFVSPARFKGLLRKGKILEWTNYLGYYYGTPRDFLDAQLAQGKYLLLCLDHKGALQIKKLYPANSVSIFVQPPSLETLKARIVGRCRSTKGAEVSQRLAMAKKELLKARRYDYCVLNKDLTQATKALQRIIKRTLTNKA